MRKEEVEKSSRMPTSQNGHSHDLASISSRIRMLGWRGRELICNTVPHNPIISSSLFL